MDCSHIWALLAAFQWLRKKKKSKINDKNSKLKGLKPLCFENVGMKMIHFNSLNATLHMLEKLFPLNKLSLIICLYKQKCAANQDKNATWQKIATGQHRNAILGLRVFFSHFTFQKALSWTATLFCLTALFSKPHLHIILCSISLWHMEQIS